MESEAICFKVLEVDLMYILGDKFKALGVMACDATPEKLSKI